MSNALLLAGAVLLSAASARAADAVSGKVAETMDSGDYTYARVVEGASSTWVAVPKMTLKIGDAAAFAPGMVMVNFESPTLHRTFPRIVFSEGPASAAAAAAPSPHVGTHAAKKDPSAKTAKASGPGALTVAELYARRAELAGKTAAVRGKVVKVNPAIMGRNWIHLQDGTGDAKAGTFDLLVTTDGEATVGETLTASGVVAKDQDYGMGYKYAVLIEKASLSR